VVIDPLLHTTTASRRTRHLLWPRGTAFFLTLPHSLTVITRRAKLPSCVRHTLPSTLPRPLRPLRHRARCARCATAPAAPAALSLSLSLSLSFRACDLHLYWQTVGLGLATRSRIVEEVQPAVVEELGGSQSPGFGAPCESSTRGSPALGLWIPTTVNGARTNWG
jgi:hypothetical protein